MASSSPGLTVSPFADNPDAPVFVETAVHRRAVAQARFGIEQGGGLVVITGEPGSGKTAVLDRTAFLVTGDDVAVVRLSANEVDGDSLEAVVLRVLRASEPGIDPDADLEDALLHCRKGGVTPALLIDDADDLGDKGLMALRRIAELEADGDPLFRIVIAGRPSLRSVFYREDMAALRQSMAASHQLGSLSREEVGEYVDARVRSAGFAGEIVATVDFLDKLAEASLGNPGKINRLAGRAIVQAGLANRGELLAADLEAGETEIAPTGDASIEDAEVVETQSASEVAATMSMTGKARLDDRLNDKDSGTVSVTELNAAIEQLGQRGHFPESSTTDTKGTLPHSDEESDDPRSSDDTDQAEVSTESDIDVWEPATPLTELEADRIDEADVSALSAGDRKILPEMQSFVTDFRDQIDSLRNTIESLRAETDRLDERRKAARKKISERIDTIQARINDIRKGD
ncbi:MAG: AAA family ATPase [Pseudomonadota bacterium]